MSGLLKALVAKAATLIPRRRSRATSFHAAEGRASGKRRFVTRGRLGLCAFVLCSGLLASAHFGGFAQNAQTDASTMRGTCPKICS